MLNGVACVQSPLGPCGLTLGLPVFFFFFFLANIHPKISLFLSWSVITLSSTASDDKQRPQITSDDERQCSVQSLTDKQGLLTHVN